MNKRLNMRLCPVCSGSVIHPDTHGPEDDLADIRRRDGGYNFGKHPLNNGDLSPMAQKAADRRMLLRILDAREAGDKAEAPE